VLFNLGHAASRETIRNILKEHGITPAPERRKRIPWSTFLQSHWGSIAAADFFTVEAWSYLGLTRYHVFFCMELSSRRVHIAGISECPYGAWMKQIGRNLTDPFDGFLAGMRYIILDRDPLYSDEFRGLLKQAGVKVIRLPARSPNLNAYAERFVRTIKESCLNQMIFFGENSLRRAANEFVEYYHHERNHQGLDNRLIDPLTEVGSLEGNVLCRERLGGVLKYYYRDAA
jgi:putative transposase